MNERWSLDNLYTGVESESFKKDFANLEIFIKDLNQWAIDNFDSIENAGEKLLTFCKKQEEIFKLEMLANYLQLRLAINSEDTQALKLLNKYEEIDTMCASYNTLLKKFLKEIKDIDNVINESNELKEFEFFIKEQVTKANYMLSEKEEILLSKMKVSGSGSFEKLRDTIISSIKININLNGENKIINFPEVRNLAYDSNKEVRKAAYEAELKALSKVDIGIAACLNSIKSEVIMESNLRGYNSVLEKTLIEARMDQEILDALLEAINESLPKLRQYYIHKSKKLGYDNGLPFYELFAPMGSVDYKFSYEEASDVINNCFEKFSPELSNLSKQAFENSWIDATPMNGKSDGAFCSSVPSIKESRILSNFTGSFSDLTTLAHELGHAFHNYCNKGERFVNQNITMPIAETASIFCEKIIEDEFIKKVDKEAKLTLLDSTLTDATQVLVDVISRFYFEDSFIKERVKGPLSSGEINNLMEEAQKKVYGDGLDKNYLHKYMWVAKPHYYDSRNNYYNFPYAYGYLFSQGVYEIYKTSPNKDEFIEDYKNLLRISGKKSLEDSAKSMGINIRDKNFWLKSIEAVAGKIDEYLSL